MTGVPQAACIEAIAVRHRAGTKPELTVALTWLLATEHSRVPPEEEPPRFNLDTHV